MITILAIGCLVALAILCNEDIRWEMRHGLGLFLLGIVLLLMVAVIVLGFLVFAVHQIV